MPQPQKINEIWAFVARIPGQDEGIPVLEMKNGTALSLVASDMQRVYELRQIALETAQRLGINIELRRYALAEIVENFSPNPQEPETKNDNEQPEHS